MKKNLLLTSLSIFIFTLSFSQQIHHIDYGDEGLVIEINEAYPMDFNSDGTIDFHINSWPDELGFTPIYEIGCFSSPSSNAQTGWGSRMLKTFNEGESIGLDFDNINDYIDDDRGSIHKPGIGFAEGWEDGVPQFIGLAVFDQTLDNVMNGWMKVKVDKEKEQLIVLEYAYHDYVEFFFSSDYSIEIGDTGLVNTDNPDQLLSAVSISPNPAQEFFSINYKTADNSPTEILILDNTGKSILRKRASSEASFVFDSSNWASGMYYINVKSENGVHTERIMIKH